MTRILIVDDELPMRRLLHNWVEAADVGVLEAGSAEEGLALVASEGTPAVALCDIRLPGNDGLWLAEQLRVSHPETAVIMTTGVNEFDAAVTSLHAGVVDYLVKPFSREQMTQALNRGLFAHRSRQALARMHAELDRRRAEIGDAMGELETNASGAVEALLGILRARHADWHAQARRVARLAVNLAMTLQIREPALSDIERAALLHNFGCLALPDTLFSRPESALSAVERAELRAYPLHGHAVLKHVPFLAAANAIAIAAHERYDGTGIPYGRRGEDIPLGARIIGVALAYDELVSGTKEPPLAPTEALDVLSRTRAAEFDPLVIGALQTLRPRSE